MEKKNEPICEPCEQMFEKKVETMVDEVENYSAADHDKRSTEVNDAFDRSGHGREHNSGSTGSSTGNPSQKQESWQKDKEHGTCGHGTYGKEENCTGRENYRKEHNAFGDRDPHSHGRDDLHKEEHRG